GFRLRASLQEEPGRPGRLLFTRSQLTIRRPQLEEGKETRSFEDAEIAVQAMGRSHLDPEGQTADLDFSAAVSQLKFVIALIPGGLPKTIAKFLLNDNAPATATGTLHATAEGAGIRDFQAEADGLSLTGSF